MALKIEQIPDIYPPYTPEKEERDLITKVYNDYRDDVEIKNTAYTIFNNRTLQKFWDDSNKDFIVYAENENTSSWVKKYPDGLTRDKVNVFLSNLAQKLIVAQIFAQNTAQVVDRIISRVLRILVKWAIKNDGRPFENGHTKFIRFVHKILTEGTSHKLVTVNDNNDHETEIIPNESVFIPNFLQPNLQKQSHFILCKDNMTYEEALSIYGGLDNFKYVVPGDVSKWALHEDPFFKEYDSSIVEDKRVQVIKCWYPVAKKDITNGKKQQKYFNIIINGVLLFPVENKDPHKHGYYPIVKTVFELLDANFYWGNSLGNKLRFDKIWIDAWRTLIMNKAKLSVMPPMFAEDGLIVDKDVYVPSKITNIQGKASQLQPVAGITPINNGELAIMQSIYDSGDKASVSPTVAGQMSQERRTLGEIELQEANATKLLNIFGIMLASAAEQEGILTAKNIIQFFPRKKIDELVKISVPNESLSDGRQGTMEIIFRNVLDLTPQQRLDEAKKIAIEEFKAKKSGVNKEVVYIDQSYADNLELFCEFIGNPIERHSEALDRYLTIQRYLQIYLNNPFINQEEAIRQVVRSNGDDEELLIKQQTTRPEDVLPINNNQVSPLATLNATPNAFKGQGIGQMSPPS